MDELMIAAVWTLTLGAIIYFAVTEIAKLLSIDDGRRLRNRQRFDVMDADREAILGKATRRPRSPRSD
jgi:hypothetical protein